MGHTLKQRALCETEAQTGGSLDNGEIPGYLRQKVPDEDIRAGDWRELPWDFSAPWAWRLRPWQEQAAEAGRNQDNGAFGWVSCSNT